MHRTGVDLVFPVTELPDVAGHVDAPRFIDALWTRWLLIHMRNRLRRTPYDPIFPGGYIGSQAQGAIAAGAWRVVDGALRLRFDDALGLMRVHAIAAAHFTRLSLAVLGLDDNFNRGMHAEGWAVTSQDDPMSLMDDVETPLIELRGALYVITGPASAPSLLSPHPTQTLTMEMLDSRERAAVKDAIEARACQCQLCEYYRPRVPKLLATAAKRAAAAADKAAKAKAPTKTKTKTKAS